MLSLVYDQCVTLFGSRFMAGTMVGGRASVALPLRIVICLLHRFRVIFALLLGCLVAPSSRPPSPACNFKFYSWHRSRHTYPRSARPSLCNSVLAISTSRSRSSVLTPLNAPSFHPVTLILMFIHALLPVSFHSHSVLVQTCLAIHTLLYHTSPLRY